MAVSKIAVIALVAIIATPILLGYAMNIDETTETDYRTTGDSVNTTQLLQTSSAYTYASADILQMNTKFLVGGGSVNIPTIPQYQSYQNTKTSLEAVAWYPNNTYYPDYAGGYPFNYYSLYYWQFDYNVNNCSLHILVTDTDNTQYSYSNIHTVYFDYTDNTVKMTRYSSPTTLSSVIVTNPASVKYSVTGSWQTSYSIFVSDNPDTNYYADISKGYRFVSVESGLPNRPYTGNVTNLPNYTRSVLFTIDLSSVSDANTQFNIGTINFEKTTTDGIVKWLVVDNTTYPNPPFEIYYDQNSTNNTYQFRMTADTVGRSVGSGMRAYEMTCQLRYVGAWPDLIGEANYYQDYKFTTEIIQVGQLNLSKIGINTLSKVSPIMRIDDAEYRAFEYPVIKDTTYDPAQFKDNPSTTISNPYFYGKSLEFGGNTYTVTNGNITMGTHKVPVKGLVLSSTPNAGGGYDNKIGNTVISTTADPSTIKFNGEWSVSISTMEQESYTYNKTEWVAGSFAWDGMDHNFIMAGLLASLGAFIGVGIYARRTKSTVWPLLIVCGGAALLFFVML